MKLKLDLHTHPFEAMNYPKSDVESVRRLVEAVKAKGLDGIAVTEHWKKEYGFSAKRIVEEHFNGEIIIIPGQELDVDDQQIVELYLEDGIIFRFLAHPGFPTSISPYPLKIIEGLHGIEVENSLHHLSCYEEDYIIKVAKESNLILLRNSDAHHFSHLGACYNRISLEELIQRVRSPLSVVRGIRKG